MWQTYKDISFTLEPHIVRVKNDEPLKKCLTARMGNAYRLSRVIREKYEEEFEKPLHITTRSLACELLVHFWVQEIVLFKELVTKKTIHRRIMARFSDKVLLHTDVIDCGERAVDGNRIVWDLLSLTKPEKKHPKNPAADAESVSNEN